MLIRKLNEFKFFEKMPSNIKSRIFARAGADINYVCREMLK